MRKPKTLCKWILALSFLFPIAPVHADSGDDEAVAKARQEYEQAMKSNDAGLQNAMKIQLAVQIAKAKARKHTDENNNARSSPNSNS